MIINNAPVNEAIVSNVSETGGFRIRQSAKAFSILSSSLYANKIKAIIRELSCNAYDSHVAAGKKEVPFDVHLPTVLEGWFSIRDYGVGLDHEQVMNLYTTYFESTKTDSNDFVGALGLGSKSPFAYTDNFTVTAIKDGKRRIYTAFIDDQGTPAIALMDTSDTSESNGVEVRFAVENRSDFDKFLHEAREVYRWFEFKPNITSHNLEIKEVEYLDLVVVDGVRFMGPGYRSSSFVLMGNIAYPIDVPLIHNHIDSELHYLMDGSSILFELPIGAVEFQPSREGLSYIPQTINAIESKLREINSTIGKHIAEEAGKIENSWYRLDYLRNLPSVFRSRAESYAINDEQLSRIDMKYGIGGYIEVYEDVLYKKYNIRLRVLSRNYNDTMSEVKMHSRIVPPKYTTRQYYQRISLDLDHLFVLTDSKVGAFTRARFHVQSGKTRPTTYVLDAADKSKPALYDEFLKDILNPPNVIKASELRQPEKEKRVHVPVSVLELVNDTYQNKQRWIDIKDINDLDDSEEQFCYVPVSGFTPTTPGLSDIYSLFGWLEMISQFTGKKIRLFGVRKGSIEAVRKLSHWHEADKFIRQFLDSLTDEQILSYSLSSITDYEMRAIRTHQKQIRYVPDDLKLLFDETVTRNSYSSVNRVMTRIINHFKPEGINERISELVEKHTNSLSRYPLLRYLSGAPTEEVENYFKLINGVK